MSLRFLLREKLLLQGMGFFIVPGDLAHDVVIPVGYLLKRFTTQSQTMPHPGADSPRTTNQSSQSQSPAVRAGLRRSAALPPSNLVPKLSRPLEDRTSDAAPESTEAVPTRLVGRHCGFVGTAAGYARNAFAMRLV